MTEGVQLCAPSFFVEGHMHKSYNRFWKTGI